MKGVPPPLKGRFHNTEARLLEHQIQFPCGTREARVALVKIYT